MKPVRFKLMTAFLLIFLCFSCTSLFTEKQAGVTENKNEKLSALLNEHARNIHHDLVKLTRIKQQKNQKLLNQIKTPAPPKDAVLKKPLTLKWAGPLEPAAKVVSRMIGYRFKRTGSAPVKEVLIHIDARQQPAFDVLRDMGWQAGQNTGLIIHETSKIIELVYVGKIR